MCGDDADVKPQEEEEMKDDSLCEDGMKRDEGHVSLLLHSAPAIEMFLAF